MVYLSISEDEVGDEIVEGGCGTYGLGFMFFFLCVFDVFCPDVLCPDLDVGFEHARTSASPKLCIGQKFLSCTKTPRCPLVAVEVQLTGVVTMICMQERALTTGSESDE